MSKTNEGDPNIEALAAWLVNAGVDPDATTIPLPAHITPGEWWQVKNHARVMLLERLPERQRQLLVLLYAEVSDEIVASAIEEAEAKAAHARDEEEDDA